MTTSFVMIMITKQNGNILMKTRVNGWKMNYIARIFRRGELRSPKIPIQTKKRLRHCNLFFLLSIILIKTDPITAPSDIPRPVKTVDFVYSKNFSFTPVIA